MTHFWSQPQVDTLGTAVEEAVPRDATRKHKKTQLENTRCTTTQKLRAKRFNLIYFFDFKITSCRKMVVLSICTQVQLIATALKFGIYVFSCSINFNKQIK